MQTSQTDVEKYDISSFLEDRKKSAEVLGCDLECEVCDL